MRYSTPMIRQCLLVAAMLAGSQASAEESVCYGTPQEGRLEGGVKLPFRGNNYVSYSWAADMAGRNYVHSTVRDIVLSAYATLETEMPDKVFKYAEAGYRDGGPFKPHRTHANGLSVDFMVPVVDPTGQSVHLPTHVLNKLGYAIEFDATGKYKKYIIDYEAMAAHLVNLHKAALEQGGGISRVVFDPGLQQYLFATSHGDYLKQHIPLNIKPSWVRHDEHYHVNFDIPCEPL